MPEQTVRPCLMRDGRDPCTELAHRWDARLCVIRIPPNPPDEPRARYTMTEVSGWACPRHIDKEHEVELPDGPERARTLIAGLKERLDARRRTDRS